MSVNAVNRDVVFLLSLCSLCVYISLFCCFFFFFFFLYLYFNNNNLTILLVYYI